LDVLFSLGLLLSGTGLLLVLLVYYWYWSIIGPTGLLEFFTSLFLMSLLVANYIFGY